MLELHCNAHVFHQLQSLFTHFIHPATGAWQPSHLDPFSLFFFLSLKGCVFLQVFRARTPPEAIALCSRLLEYTPTARLTPLDACAHSFFDELRDPNPKLPNGRDFPALFNFTTQGNAVFSGAGERALTSHVESGTIGCQKKKGGVT